MVRRQNFVSSDSRGPTPAPTSSNGRPKCSWKRAAGATQLTDCSPVSDHALTALAHGIWTSIKTYRYLKKGVSPGKDPESLPELHYQQVRGVIEKAEMDNFLPFLESFARAISQMIQIHGRDTDERRRNLVRLYRLANRMDVECKGPGKVIYATTWRQIRQLANKIEARCGRRCLCVPMTTHLAELEKLSTLAGQALIRVDRSQQAHPSTTGRNTAASHASVEHPEQPRSNAAVIASFHSAIEQATEVAVRAILPVRTRDDFINYLDDISSLARHLQRLHRSPPAEPADKVPALKRFESSRAAAASRSKLPAGTYKVSWTAFADLGRQVRFCPSGCRCHPSDLSTH